MVIKWKEGHNFWQLASSPPGEKMKRWKQTRNELRYKEGGRGCIMTPMCQECLQCTGCAAGKPGDQVPHVSCRTRLFSGLTPAISVYWDRGRDGHEEEWDCDRTVVFDQNSEIKEHSEKLCIFIPFLADGLSVAGNLSNKHESQSSQFQ